jgi:hypothetical protein
MDALIPSIFNAREMYDQGNEEKRQLEGARLQHMEVEDVDVHENVH